MPRRARVIPRRARARAWLRTALALAAGLTLVGCGPRFDRRAMLDGIGTSVILPAHDALLAEARELDAAAAAFRATPGEATLLALRDRWLDTELAWRGVQLYQLEGLLLLHNAVEKRPARADFIEEAIASRAAGSTVEIDADFVAGIGATSKGLGAIEYLIFPSAAPDGSAPDPAEVAAAFSESARGEYLTALTGNLLRTAEELRAFWTAEDDGYLATFVEADSDGADVQGSISRLANRMIEMHEIATRDWIGRPTGRTTDGVARAEDVEAPLSGRSLELLIASEEAIRRAFEAGLDDYLDHLDPEDGDDRLSRRIVGQLDVVLESLRSIEGPLERAVIDDPATVEAAYDEMRELVVLLKSDMAARLGITVTFSDADGD